MWGNRTASGGSPVATHVTVDDDVLAARQVIGEAEIDEHHLPVVVTEKTGAMIVGVFRIVGGIIVKLPSTGWCR